MDGRWDRRELLRHGLTVAAAGVAAPWLVAADGAPPHVAGAERGAVGGPLGEVYGRFGAPRGVALTQTADIATTRTVTWLSSGRRDPGSVVRYGAVPAAARGEGIAPSRLTRRTPGTSVIAPFGTFDRDLGESVGPADGEVPVRVHTATMRGLLPGRTYAYQVGTEAGWSPVRTFTTPGSRDEWRFTHVGDHGVTAASRRLNAAVLAREPDLHLFAGDLSYANGRQPVWDRWSQQLEPLAARIPILYAPGNHEAQDFFGETYRRRFARAQQDVAWFGIDVGNVHVTSTTAGAFIAGHNEVAGVRELLLEELSFLERDLADAARRRAAGEIDFLAVLQHFPLFTEERARGPFSPELVLLEEQLLQRYAVDLVLVGHDHGYQRSRPMMGGIPLDPRGQLGLGYVQVVAGAGGQSLREFTPVGPFDLDVDPEVPYHRGGLWSAAREPKFSFVEYVVQGPTIEATTYGWTDREGQHLLPQRGSDDPLIRIDPDAIDPDLAFAPLDRFTIRRKPAPVIAAAAAAGTVGRLVTRTSRTLPELDGRVVADPAEDCTRHHH